MENSSLSFADGALTLKFEGECAWLILDRPARRNAINHAMWVGLGEAARAVDADSSAKVMIVRGAGGHFAAGADISEFGDIVADSDLTGRYARDVHDGLFAVSRMEKPSLAMIEGSCVGGGTALALACDIRLAAGSAKLGVTPAKLGLVYNMLDTRLLVDAVGPSMARDILYTGRLMDAEEARRVGLVDHVLSEEDLVAAVADRAATLCANSQWSIRQAKKMVRRALDGQAHDDELTREVSRKSFLGEDLAEGRTAFLEKRPPNFPYR